MQVFELIYGSFALMDQNANSQPSCVQCTCFPPHSAPYYSANKQYFTSFNAFHAETSGLKRASLS